MKFFALKKIILALALFVAIIAVSSSASAESLLAYAFRANNWTSATSPVLVPLNAANATALSFTTTAAAKLVKITYNAECGVLGPSESWLSVTILVDGIQAQPNSGTQFALCTATSTGLYTWEGTVRQSLIRVPAKGAHNVTVQVNLNNGATDAWLGDTSIMVEEQ